MRQSFREWYPPTDTELKSLWTDAVVILDSSVLLSLYQYPQQTLDGFLGVLESVRDRLWLPHQVGLEYHRNREGRIPEQRLVLQRLLGEVNSLSSNLNGLSLPEFHPTLNLEQVESQRSKLKSALGTLGQLIQFAHDTTPELSPAEILTQDPLFDRITQLFDGRIGPAMSNEELAELQAEGARRYEAEVPPGFKDRDKDERHRYNDLVIWKQILRMAGGSGDDASRSSIFVTNDRKEEAQASVRSWSEDGVDPGVPRRRW